MLAAFTASSLAVSSFAYSLLKRQPSVKENQSNEQSKPLLRKQILEQCILVVPTCYNTVADIRFQLCLEFIADALKNNVRLLIIDGRLVLLLK